MKIQLVIASAVLLLMPSLAAYGWTQAPSASTEQPAASQQQPTASQQAQPTGGEKTSAGGMTATQSQSGGWSHAVPSCMPKRECDTLSGH